MGLFALVFELLLTSSIIDSDMSKAILYIRAATFFCLNFPTCTMTG